MRVSRKLMEYNLSIYPQEERGAHQNSMEHIISVSDQRVRATFDNIWASSNWELFQETEKVYIAPDKKKIAVNLRGLLKNRTGIDISNRSNGGYYGEVNALGTSYNATLCINVYRKQNTPRLGLLVTECDISPCSVTSHEYSNFYFPADTFIEITKDLMEMLSDLLGSRLRVKTGVSYKSTNPHEHVFNILEIGD